MHNRQKHFAIILFSTSFEDILFLLSQSLCFCSNKKSSKKILFCIFSLLIVPLQILLAFLLFSFFSLAMFPLLVFAVVMFILSLSHASVYF